MIYNSTRKGIFLNALSASVGLFIFGFGVYLTIQANLGVAPWDVFCIGLAQTLNVQYGTAAISISLLILCIDIALGEKLGIGMLLDAFIIGKTVDLFNYLALVPKQNSYLWGIIILFLGMTIMGFSQFLYMRTGLGCGPRDTLLVGLSRKIVCIPIGVISIFIMVTVTFIGWLLGGPLGIGTVLVAAFIGLIMQYEFMLLNFVATDVQHQSFQESYRVLRNKAN